MTIYVDDYRGKFGRMIMCHMVSDTSLEELHEFALKLGLKLEWFQNEGRLPHYDLSLNKRRLAIQLGATELPIRDGNWREVMARVRLLKE